MWTKKKLKMNYGRPLRDIDGGSRNTFTVGNGRHLRATSENVEWTGKPVHRTGVWPRRAARSAGKAGQPADPGGEATQGSLHLIRGGSLVAFCPTGGFSPGRHAGNGHRPIGQDRRDRRDCRFAVLGLEPDPVPKYRGRPGRDGQPPIIDLASKAGKPRNSRITSATRWMRTASTGPTG